MNELQGNQRLAEILKKRELFNDYWNQTIKPKNKVLDISYQKVLLAEEQVVRTGGMLWNIKRRESYDDDSETEEED